MSLLAEAHFIFNIYTYYIYLNHFYDAVSLFGKINKTRKYILSFIWCAINYEIEDDWEILEDKEEQATPLIGYKESLQREELIEKDHNLTIKEQMERKMSSSPVIFRGHQPTDLPHFVLSNY